MGTTDALSRALLEWVNTFRLPKRITDWKELQDGIVIWEILRDVDPEYFSEELPEPNAGASRNWIERWKNLRHIYSRVTTYIPEECGALYQLSKRDDVDLQSIAKDDSKSNPADLLKWVLFAASVSPTSNQRLLPVIDGLPTPTKIALAESVMRMQQAEEELLPNSDETEDLSEAEGGADYDSVTESEHIMSSPPRVGIKKDDLQYEAEIIALRRDKRSLEAEKNDLLAENDQLQAYIESLEERVTEANLGIGNKSKTEGEDESVARVKAELEKERDIISALETQNGELQKKIEVQARELARFKDDGRGKQELRDELQQLTTERDELLPKARGYLNLQKKVQSQQDEMKTLEKLRDRLQSENQTLKELEPLREKYAALEKADHEKYNTIANNEQKIFEMKQYEKQLQHDLYALTQSHDSLKSLYERAQAMVAEQAEKLQDLESMREAGNVAMGDLEAELVEQDRQEEIITGKPAGTAANLLPADNSLLQRTIENLRKRLANLEDQYLDVYEENIALKEIRDGKVVDNNSQPFIHQQQKLESAIAELEDFKSKYSSAVTEITELQVRLNGERTAVEGTEDTTTALKDNKLRQAYIKQLETDLEERKSLLHHTLSSHHGLRRIGDQERRIAEAKVINEQLRVVHEAAAQEFDNALNFATQRLVDKIEGGYIVAEDAEKRAKEYSDQLESLRREFDKLKNQKQSPEKAVPHEQVAALKRELKLMSSFVCGFMGRVQYNHVTVNKRSETPKTFIGRQRVSVGQAVSVRR